MKTPRSLLIHLNKAWGRRPNTPGFIRSLIGLVGLPHAWKAALAGSMLVLALHPAPALACADVRVSKSGADVRPLGCPLAYQINVGNAGNETAANVMLTDTLPSDVILLYIINKTDLS